MKDFSKQWPVLTRFGEHEAIMNRLALYMDWTAVEEPEQADLLLEHYQKDVGRLIRTLTYARTPSAEIAAAVMELAEKHSEPISAALRVMFFVFRLLNTAQGISLGGTEAVTPEAMARLMEIAMGLIDQSKHPGKLPCTECYEWQDGIPELLAHMRSEHPHLNEGAETMTPQENESNGGEAQADASAGVEKTHEQIVAEAKEAEAKQALADLEALDEPEKTTEPKTADGSSEVTEPEPEAAPGVDEMAPEFAVPGPPVSDVLATETEMGAGSDGDSDEEEGESEPDARDEVEQPRVDEVARTNCITIIADMYEVTTRNHLKPKEWWEQRLGALREFIANA